MPNEYTSGAAQTPAPRRIEDHPFFSEHSCERCDGVGKDFYCEMCDATSPMDCLHVAPWLDYEPDWDRDWNEEEG